MPVNQGFFEIINHFHTKTLQSRQSFRVQAGAGSGKTYSLNKVIDWIQDNYWHSLNLKKQKVACITYTKDLNYHKFVL